MAQGGPATDCRSSQSAIEKSDSVFHSPMDFYENLTDTLSGGTYKGAIELP
jgi:hypothetical protein